MVKKEEQEIFGEQPKEEEIGKQKSYLEPKPEVYAEKGFYLAFTHFNDKVLDVNLINK